MSTFNYARDLRQSPKNRHANASYAVETVRAEYAHELARIPAGTPPLLGCAGAAATVAIRHGLSADRVVDVLSS